LQYGLIYPKARPPSPAAQLLIRHLRAVAAEKLQSVDALLAAAPGQARPKAPRGARRGAAASGSVR